MDLFTRSDLKPLLEERQTHCVSVFMPTRRGGGEQDPIRWRIHLGEAEEMLVQAGLRAPEAREQLEPARRLLDDPIFWQSQCDGLAYFLASPFERLYRLPLAFEDLVVVGPRFHVTPLLPLLGGNGRFYVLAVSRNAVRLLQGTRDAVSAVDLTGVPHDLAAALLTRQREPVRTITARPTGAGGPWQATSHGVGVDDPKEDLLHYFQQIDRALHPVLRRDEAPLALAAVDYLQPIYRQANSYPHLVAEGVAGNPDHLSDKQLHDRAWPLVQPGFEEAQQNAASQYRELAGTGRTACDLRQIVPAAGRGEVETLFVARDTQRWGRFDPATGKVEEREHAQPGDEDLLNYAAAHTLLHDGAVYAVALEEMPDRHPAAATFRLPLAKRGKRP